MTAVQLLADLEAAGVSCALDAAGELVIRAPKGVLTAEHREAVRQRRAELVRLLTMDEADTALEPHAAIAAPAAASEGASDRRRYYTTNNRLDSALWAAGYRLCDRCGGLTIHRLTCLRCDPSGVNRIEPGLKEHVA